MRGNFLIDLPGVILVRLDLGAVVEVRGDERPVLVGGLDRLQRQLAGRRRDQREDPACVEDANALVAEDGLPIHVARLELPDGRVGAVVAGIGRDDPLADEREVDAVAQRPLGVGRESRAVGGGVEPDDLAGIHARGSQLVANVPAYLVVHKRRDDCRPQAERVSEPAGDVRLPAALVDPHQVRPGGRHVERVQPQHHLAQRDAVVTAGVRRLDVLVSDDLVSHDQPLPIRESGLPSQVGHIL